MLEHFKRPGLYLNHGVWFFKENRGYPIKNKITQINVEFSLLGFRVLEIFVNGAGWLKPNQVYMTRRSALIESVLEFKVKRQILEKELKWKQDSLQAKINHVDKLIASIQKYQNKKK